MPNYLGNDFVIDEEKIPEFDFIQKEEMQDGEPMRTSFLARHRQATVIEKLRMTRVARELEGKCGGLDGECK